jgi:hypothetical protein
MLLASVGNFYRTKKRPWQANYFHQKIKELNFHITWVRKLLVKRHQLLREFAMSFRPLSSLLAGLSLVACTSVLAAPLPLTITDTFSNGVLGSATNEVYAFQVGANATITSISYNVNLTALAPSYLSEMSLLFSPSAGKGVAFQPAGGQLFAGTGTYAGFIDLIALDTSFQVGSDGLLRLEFYESFNDIDGADGVWNFGMLVIGVQDAETAVPEPGTSMLIGAGLLLLSYAGRRRTRSTIL